MKYEPRAFWTAHGPHLAPPGASSPEQVAVEVILEELLPRLGPFDDVLDVGCGQGRLAALLERVLPDTRYSGLDLAEAQLEGTAKVRPDGEFFLSTIEDFSPDREWDLVLVSEVLLHVKPDTVQLACDRLREIARQKIVIIDWTQHVHGAIAKWNFLHDYHALLGSIEEEHVSGLQSVMVVAP